MKYIYPAVFDIESGTKETYNVHFPDLPGCNTFGDGLTEAMEMAQDALSLCLMSKEDDKDIIPAPTPTNAIKVTDNAFVSLVTADTNAYRRGLSVSVRKNVTIPKWLAIKAEQENINYSQTLQEALKEKLHLV